MMKSNRYRNPETGNGPQTSTPEANRPHRRRRRSTERQSAPEQSKWPLAPRTAYFVHILVGVHSTHPEAKAAFRALPLSVRPPVWFERNVNGMGKCKTWLAISIPYSDRFSADVASRRMAAFTGEGAVCVRRGDR